MGGGGGRSSLHVSQGHTSAHLFENHKCVTKDIVHFHKQTSLQYVQCSMHLK